MNVDPARTQNVESIAASAPSQCEDLSAVRKLLWNALPSASSISGGTMWNRGRSRQFATFWKFLIAGQILSNDSLLPYHSLDIFNNEFIFNTFVLAISMGESHLLHPLVIFLWYVLEKIAQIYFTPIILLLGKDSRPWQAWWWNPSVMNLWFPRSLILHPDEVEISLHTRFSLIQIFEFLLILSSQKFPRLILHSIHLQILRPSPTFFLLFHTFYS